MIHWTGGEIGLFLFEGAADSAGGDFLEPNLWNLSLTYNSDMNYCCKSILHDIEFLENKKVNNREFFKVVLFNPGL